MNYESMTSSARSSLFAFADRDEANMREITPLSRHGLSKVDPVKNHVIKPLTVRVRPAPNRKRGSFVAVLTDDEVVKIRVIRVVSLLVNDPISMRKIASDFGVSHSHISKILRWEIREAAGGTRVGDTADTLKAALELIKGNE